MPSLLLDGRSIRLKSELIKIKKEQEEDIFFIGKVCLFNTILKNIIQ